MNGKDAEEKKSHYVWMEKRFDSDKMWTWVVNLLAYAAMITSYFLIDGHEIIYAMYLPLDMGLNVCKAGYFFIMYGMEKYKREQEEKLKQALAI